MNHRLSEDSQDTRFSDDSQFIDSTWLHVQRKAQRNQKGGLQKNLKLVQQYLKYIIMSATNVTRKLVRIFKLIQ